MLSTTRGTRNEEKKEERKKKKETQREADPKETIRMCLRHI